MTRAPDFQETQTLTYAKNHARVHPIELSKIFGDSKTGLALVSVNSNELEFKPADGYRELVQVTDLAAHIKIAPKKSLSAQALIPKDAPTGFFSVSAVGTLEGGDVRIGTEFRIEEYRAPQFRVDVESPKKSLVAGDALEANVFARYLFGGAMANAQTKWSVSRLNTSFAPESAREFTFNQETWWWDDHEPETADGFFASGDGVADAKGSLTIKAGTTEAPGGKPYTYTIEADVTDVNRQSVAGRTEVTVHPAAVYVGLKANTSFMQTGTEYPSMRSSSTPRANESKAARSRSPSPPARGNR